MRMIESESDESWAELMHVAALGKRHFNGGETASAQKANPPPDLY